MNTPAEEIIERFLAMFGEPRTTNPDLFLTEYQKALTGYDADLLHRAADKVMKTATFWPKPAEVLAVVTDIAAERYRHRPAEHIHGDLPKRTPEELKAAQDMVDGLKKIFAERQIEIPLAELDWSSAHSPGFNDMQRKSLNVGLHRSKSGLSQISKRMTGDRE